MKKKKKKKEKKKMQPPHSGQWEQRSMVQRKSRYWEEKCRVIQQKKSNLAQLFRHGTAIANQVHDENSVFSNVYLMLMVIKDNVIVAAIICDL